MNMRSKGVERLLGLCNGKLNNQSEARGLRGCWAVAAANLANNQFGRRGFRGCWDKTIWDMGLERLLGPCDGKLNTNLGQRALEAAATKQFWARGSRGCWVVATANLTTISKTDTATAPKPTGNTTKTDGNSSKTDSHRHSCSL